MKKNTLRECPFEYMRDRNGNKFSEETVGNWYKSRAFVLDRLDGNQQDVVVDGDSPLMLSVVRHLALYSHYISNKPTVITLVSQNATIEDELKKEEYLCHLVDYLKRADCDLDIELRIVKEFSDDLQGVRITESDVNEFVNKKGHDDVYTVDTRKAVLAQRIYELGALIDNLTAEDIHSTKRYAMALDAFEYLLRDKIKPLIDKAQWENDPIKVKNGLSSIYSADCFELRALAMKNDKNYKKWEENNEALSISEHARWVVERLIMGYRPINHEERMQYESLFGQKRQAYFKVLKNNVQDLAHIDICSYRDLRRIDPNSLKYDSFLMLAIPRILKRLKH
ncbi:MAG: hypothetical protein J6X10_03775 [Bacteroidales bacterium]|nr:hypothetical protein [Bacteroidales bacterium]